MKDEFAPLIDKATNSLTRRGYVRLFTLLNTWIAEHPHGDPPTKLTVHELRTDLAMVLDTWLPEVAKCVGCDAGGYKVPAAFEIECRVKPLYAPDIEGFTDKLPVCLYHLEDPGPIFGWTTNIVSKPEATRVAITKR